MRCVRNFAWALVAVFVFSSALQAQSTGFGSRIRNLSWFQRDADTASSTASTTPVAPSQSQPAFPRSSLAPRPSVTIPSATSPTGDIPLVARNDKPAFGSRIWGAMSSAKESLTIKPREVAAPDPIRLDNRTPADVEAPVFVSAARVYEMQGRLREAREYYEKALAAEPKHLDALIGLARLEHREGDLVAATEKYQRALRMHPNNAVVLNDLGLCYARDDKLQQAEQSISRAVEQDPRSKLYRNNLALVMVEMGRDDEALTQLKTVHNEAIAHYNMAYLLREKGQHDAASTHLRTSLQIDPRMEPARAMLARLNPAPAMRHDTQLGAPQIERPRGAPVARQQPTQSPVGGQRLPVSHRQDAGASAPANVGPVRVRFDNGAPSDYRRGPAAAPALNNGADDQRGEQPDWNTTPPVTGGHAGAHVVRPDNDIQSGYNPNYREAPSPGQMPDYLQRPGPAPVQSQAPPQLPHGASRWSSPR